MRLHHNQATLKKIYDSVKRLSGQNIHAVGRNNMRESTELVRTCCFLLFWISEL